MSLQTRFHWHSRHCRPKKARLFNRRLQFEPLEGRRLLAAADLDTTFDFDGVVLTPIGNSNDHGRSIAIQADGKLVVAGFSVAGSSNDFAVARYHTDGSLDTSFEVDGKVTTSFGSGYATGRSVAIQADGKIVVAGYTHNGTNEDFALARYNANVQPLARNTTSRSPAITQTARSIHRSVAAAR
jgi:uncharacterized delta-60 repeat protein